MATLWAYRAGCAFAVCMVTVVEDSHHVLLDEDLYEKVGVKCSQAENQAYLPISCGLAL